MKQVVIVKYYTMSEYFQIKNSLHEYINENCLPHKVLKQLKGCNGQYFLSLKEFKNGNLHLTFEYYL